MNSRHLLISQQPQLLIQEIPALLFSPHGPLKILIILWDIKLCQMCSMTFHLQIFQMFPRNQKLGRRRQVLPLPNLHLRHQDLPGKRSRRRCSMNLSQHQRYKYSNSMNVVQRAEKDIKVHIRNCESPFQYPGFYSTGNEIRVPFSISRMLH